MRRLIILLALCLGCQPRIKEGRVVEKYHEPAHQYHTILMVPIVHSAGKVTYTTFIPIPYTIYDDEDWCITIVNNVDGKNIVRYLWVSESTYNSLQTGCWYTAQGCDEGADPDRKVKRE